MPSPEHANLVHLAGQKHVLEVTGLVFAYIGILKNPGGITQERWGTL